MSQGSSIDINFMSCFTNVVSQPTIEDLRQFSSTPVPGQVVIASGFTQYNDSRGSVFVWNPTSLVNDNGTSVIKINDIKVGRWIQTSISDSIQDSALPNDPLFYDSQAGDGIRDARSSIVSAMLVGDVLLRRGVYVIASDLVVTKNITFQPGARLLVNPGVTVTFSQGVQAGSFQLFNLSATSNIRGLSSTRLEWFVGDYRDKTVECRFLIQKAIDATTEYGILYSGPAKYLIDGQPLLFKAQSFIGAGKRSTQFFWTGTTTNGFAAKDLGFGYTSGMWKSFGFLPAVPGTIPTAGIAVDVNQSERSVEDFAIKDAYDGLRTENLVICNIRDFIINGSRRVGFWCLNGISDLKVDDGVIQNLSEWVTVTGASGTLNFLQNVSLKRGGVVVSGGQITEVYDATRFRMIFYSEKPQAGDVLETSSGVTATISDVTVGHQLGGIRWEVNGADIYQEAMCFDDIDVLGGEFTWTASGKMAVGRGGNSAYNHMKSGMYFDTSWQGASLDGLYGTVIDAWFATSRQTDRPGIALVRASRVRGSPHLVNNAGAGIQWDETCSDLEFTAIRCEGNTRKVSSAVTSSMADIRVLGPAKQWRLIGGSAGFQGSNGITPLKALYIAPTGGDDIKIIGFNCPNNSIFNGATGLAQEWQGVNGAPNRTNIGGVTNATDDADAFTKGVPIGGTYRTGSVIKIRVS